MKLLNLIGSNVYSYIIIAFSILLALIGYQRKELKETKKEAETLKHNNQIIIKARDIERAIDQIKTEKEQEAQNKHLKQVKDLGDITNEVNNLSDDALIDSVNSLLNNKKD